MYYDSYELTTRIKSTNEYYFPFDCLLHVMHLIVPAHNTNDRYPVGAYPEGGPPKNFNKNDFDFFNNIIWTNIT